MTPFRLIRVVDRSFEWRQKMSRLVAMAYLDVALGALGADALLEHVLRLFPIPEADIQTVWADQIKWGPGLTVEEYDEMCRAAE